MERFKNPPFILLLLLKMEYTKYEMARIIGARATQISQGAPLLMKFSEKDLEMLSYSPLEIAKKEYQEGMIPITIRQEEELKKDGKN